MIRELHEKLVTGKVTAEALVHTYLARIDAVDSGDEGIGAFISVDRACALQQAKVVDSLIAEGEHVPLLAGIPGAIKDLINIKDQKTTAGSRMLADYVSPYDATVIEKLRGTHAVFLGKTNLDEFACGGSTEHSAYGVTRNPQDISRVPGGSSGGSAAAVAAAEAVCSLGTDTGGSIRQPSSFCGTVGLKPTYGRVSRYGVIAYGSSLDQVGPIASTVEDCAIVLSAIAGQDVRDATTAHSDGQTYENFLGEDLTGKKIGIVKEFLSDGLDPRVQKVFLDAVEKYKSLGAEIVDVSLPYTDDALAAYYVIATSELSSNLARFDGIRFGSTAQQKDFDSLIEYYKHVRGEGFGAEIKRRLMLGTYTLSAGYFDAYYKKAQKVRTLIRQDYEKAFEKVDFLFTPTAPEVAFKLGDRTEDPLKMYLTDIYNVPANLAGVPALSLPIGTIVEGDVSLPVGGQILGKWFDEEGVLNAGHMWEQSII